MIIWDDKDKNKIDKITSIGNSKVENTNVDYANINIEFKDKIKSEEGKKIQKDLDFNFLHFKLLTNVGMLIYLVCKWYNGFEMYQYSIKWSIGYCLLGILSTLYSYEFIKEFIITNCGIYLPTNLV